MHGLLFATIGAQASMVRTIVLGVVISESGQFISFFWEVYSTRWTAGLYLECLCLPDSKSIVLVEHRSDFQKRVVGPSHTLEFRATRI